MHRQYRPQARAGFTLLELLVVIAIIALLLTLVSAAALRLINTQQQANTVTGFKLCSNKVATQWQAVADQAFKDNSPAYDAWCSANGGINRQGYVTAKLKQAFPTTFYQALNPGPGLSPWPAYQTYLNGVTANPTPQSYEGSVCLLMILSMGPGNTGTSADALGAANVRNVSGNLQGIVDGFQNPVQFAWNPAGNGVVISTTLPDGTTLNSNNLP
jgi:prepilin-type N-terminal cleavage/methylation domain-containing protein